MRFLLLSLFLPTLLLAQAPPIQRQIFTTNTDPFIVGTGGIGVSSNRANGRWTIDGSGISGGSGSNYTFNPNQFTSTAGGTNWTIKSGALITNQNAFNITNFGWYLGEGGFTNKGGFEVTSPGGLNIMRVDAQDLYVNTELFLTTATPSTVAYFDGARELVSILNAGGVLTNDGAGTVGWFDLAQIGGSFNPNQFDSGGGVTSIKDGALVTNLVVKGTLTGDSWNITGPGTATLGADILLQQGADSNFREGINWDNGSSALANDGLIFLGPLTASTVLSLDASKKTASIPNGAGALTNNGAGGFGWAPFQPGSSILTNVANGTLPTVPPFVVIDNVAFYPTNPWKNIVSEEWMGDTSTGNIAQNGTHAWTSGTAGTGTQFRRNPIDGVDALGFLSIQITNAAAVQASLGGSSGTPNGFALTNYEYIVWARIALTTTNTTGEIRTSRVGFSNSGAFVTDTGTGNYVMINTNLNTNSFVMVTANSGGRTFTYSSHPSNSWTALTFFNVGFRLDSTGTNYTMIVGSSYTNMTSVATNNLNAPGSLLCGPFFQAACIGSVGNIARTNYCDRFSVWVRPITANF